MAKRQIMEEGAQAILIGCLAITTHIIPGSRERLEDKLGVPVIDGSPIAIKMAELMVALELRQSKVAYPK
jgi:Asp/Glu/hydantoin racemase